MSAAELNRIATLCEKATGPDRELDRTIVLALAPEAMFDDFGDISDRPIVYHAEPFVPWKVILPNYSGSIDAALTLVPEGWRVNSLTEYNQGTWGATLRGPLQGDARLHAYSRTKGNRNGSATPALALSSAALRARAAAEPQEGE